MFQQKDDLKLKAINTVFVLHDCNYPNCLKSFLSIPDLITHIEQDHLDFSPSRVEQLESERLESIPMSYVLRFSDKSAPPPRYVHRNENSFSSSSSSSVKNNPESSNKKRESFNKSKPMHPVDDFSEILSIIQHEPYTTDMKLKKPYGCNMPGCQKRFKNVNGIKYHYKNYHKVYQQQQQAPPALKRSVLKNSNTKVIVKNNSEPVINKAHKKSASDWNMFSQDNFAALMDLFVKNEDVGSDTRYLLNAGCTSNEYSIFDAIPANLNNFNMVD